MDVILPLVITGAFIIAWCFLLRWLYTSNRPTTAVPWKAPKDLNNEDRAWLNSQFELAGATDLQMAVALTAKAPIQAGRNRRPEYKRRPQAEMDKAVGYLKNLEAKRGGVENFAFKLETPTYETVLK